MIAVAVVMNRTPAFAGDRITELTQMLSSSSEKTRMSAVLSLARLGDKRTMKPLVTALQDPNAQVRAIAATALGKLGHKAALPALKNAATDDLDDTVRAKAHEAAVLVAKANNIKDDQLTPPAAGSAQARKKTTGFGRSPHAVADQPDLYVTIKGTNDDSPGKTDKNTRKLHADILKLALQDQLKAAPQVTMVAADAQRWGLDPRMIDVSVVKLDVVQDGTYMVVDAELRLAITDDKGKMLSFLSGGAKVQVPVAKYKPKFLPSMRKDALEGAMKGMFDKLLAHLRQMTTT
ncbi:MAG TPA: HEAT repeat domain-containing protein [Kofleriaceae bacterium]|nr:HEAT repeat domain-containing protein [Kofleriaceae bacterium]